MQRHYDVPKEPMLEELLARNYNDNDRVLERLEKPYSDLVEDMEYVLLKEFFSIFKVNSWEVYRYVFSGDYMASFTISDPGKSEDELLQRLNGRFSHIYISDNTSEKVAAEAIEAQKKDGCMIIKINLYLPASLFYTTIIPKLFSVDADSK